MIQEEGGGDWCMNDEICMAVEIRGPVPSLMLW